MTLALITKPLLEPLALSEVKLHLRIDHDHEDDLLTDTLRAARQYTEFASGKKLITQVWRQYEPCLPSDHHTELHVAPVQAIEAVTAFDMDGNAQVLAATDYGLERGMEPAVLTVSDEVLPHQASNGLEIDVRVGYGDLGIDVPDTLKRGILLLVAHWYEFRGAVSPEQQPVSLPAGFETLMLPFRGARL